MQEKIHERVSVIMVFDRDVRVQMPVKIKWAGRVHRITKVGYHHTIKNGRTTQHIYSVSNDSMAFRLNFDTESLVWILEEVSDGTAG